jgi:16S rRNA processing protein RimM
MADRICVARIGAAHGVRGEVKLWTFTEEPLALADYNPLETQDGARTFEIEVVRAAKDHVIARIAGADDRDAVQKLTHLELYVSRDRLPPVEDGAYYHHDLIGLIAETKSGETLGTVLAIHNFGAGDVIEIGPLDGGDSVMLPFTDEVVPEVDLDGKRVVVVPPGAIEAREG